MKTAKDIYEGMNMIDQKNIDALYNLIEGQRIIMNQTCEFFLDECTYFYDYIDEYQEGEELPLHYLLEVPHIKKAFELIENVHENYRKKRKTRNNQDKRYENILSTLVLQHKKLMEEQVRGIKFSIELYLTNNLKDAKYKKVLAYLVYLDFLAYCVPHVLDHLVKAALDDFDEMFTPTPIFNEFKKSFISLVKDTLKSSTLKNPGQLLIILRQRIPKEAGVTWENLMGVRKDQLFKQWIGSYSTRFKNQIYSHELLDRAVKIGVNGQL